MISEFTAGAIAGAIGGATLTLVILLTELDPQEGRIQVASKQWECTQLPDSRWECWEVK